MGNLKRILLSTPQVLGFGSWKIVGLGVLITVPLFILILSAVALLPVSDKAKLATLLGIGLVCFCAYFELLIDKK